MATRDLERRTVLRAALAAGCVLCLPNVGHAQSGKASKAQARYQDKRRGDGNCRHMHEFHRRGQYLQGRGRPSQPSGLVPTLGRETRLARGQVGRMPMMGVLEAPGRGRRPETPAISKGEET